MQGLVTQLEVSSDREVACLEKILTTQKDNARLVKEEKKKEIATCLRMVVESRAPKNLDEYF